MKKSNLLFLMFLFLSVSVFGQQPKTEDEDNKAKEEQEQQEEEKKEDTKNVMLNAESNSGPRVINVGLPGMDMSIFEDGLPVVPYFWPQNPLTIWRYDQSIERINLASFSENALIAGKTGYLIDTHSRQGGRKFRGYASLRGSSYGFVNGEVNISGPLKKNWFYSLSTNYSYGSGYRSTIPDVSSSNSLSKLFIVKKFKDRKGELLFGAKYASSIGNNNVYVPFIYKEGGDYEQVDGFDVLRDSYYPRDTKVTSLNRLDGTESEVDMAKGMKNETFAYDFGFKYNFNNGWKLNFRNRLHKAKVAISLVRPIGGATQNGLGVIPPHSILTYADDGSTFDNPNQLVQMSAHVYNNPMDYTTFASRFEMTKKSGNHSYRVGTMFMLEDQDEFVSNNTLFLHEVAPDPRKIDAVIALPPQWGGGFRPITENGQLPHVGNFGYIDGSRSDMGVYFSDRWEVSPVFTLSYGGRLNYRWYDAYSADSSTPLEKDNQGNFTEFINDREKTHIDDNLFYWQGYLNGEYKLSKLTGFLFEATKNEITPILSAFSVGDEVNTEKRQPIYSGKFGVFYNHPKINIVSSLDYIKKKNDIQAISIRNPENPAEKEDYKIYHNLQTLGWVTDVIAKPFKNFELHTMFTLQTPEYDGFEFESYGTVYNFNGKVPGGISEILVEIDPSYYFAKRKLKAWASFRYFSKQYASFSNLLYYKPRWETFAGIDYRITRKLSAELTIYNLLDYAGMKGTIQNSTKYTEENISTAYNTYQSGETMLPRHAELKIKYKF